VASSPQSLTPQSHLTSFSSLQPLIPHLWLYQATRIVQSSHHISRYKFSLIWSATFLSHLQVLGTETWTSLDIIKLSTLVCKYIYIRRLNSSWLLKNDYKSPFLFKLQLLYLENTGPVLNFRISGDIDFPVIS
jgi:hypothetical protein